MANYDVLKTAIQNAVDWDNNDKQISGNDILAIFLSIIDSIAVTGYQFLGIATPETVPGTPDQRVFYIGASGTYPNFGPAVIPDGNLAIFYYDSSWHYGSVGVGDTNAVKFVAQILTDAQKAQARTNISAASSEKLSQLQQMIEDIVIGMGQLVVSLFKKTAFLSNDAEMDINALESLLAGGVTRIEAVYTQRETVYVGQSLDDLRTDLTVTAHYLNGTSNVISAYTLSGNLVSGISTITVSFGGATDTFNVTVTDAVYYRDGKKFIQPYFLSSSNTNYRPAVVDGVTLVYTRSKNSSNVVQVSRACYPYFDLDLTKGTNYKWMVKLSGLPAGAKINVALQYHNQAFKTDGLANNLANHSSDIFDSGWLASTINNGVLSFTYGAESASSALSLVGARLNLRLLNSSDQDISWPSESSIDALIIQTV